jgi:hypothetical protein
MINYINRALEIGAQGYSLAKAVIKRPDTKIYAAILLGYQGLYQVIYHGVNGASDYLLGRNICSPIAAGNLAAWTIAATTIGAAYVLRHRINPPLIPAVAAYAAMHAVVAVPPHPALLFSESSPKSR